MMTGPFAAKSLVCDYLRADLPARLTRYRNMWNLPEEDVPLPNGYHPYAPPSIEYMGEKMPVLYTVVISTDAIDRLGHTINHDPDYRVTYSARTFIWVKHAGMDVAVRSRDHLMTVTRAAMLDHQCLSHADTENREVKFDESTLREEFSDPVPPVKGNRWAAGGYLSYQLTINEIVTREPLGEVEEFDVDVIQAWNFLEND